MWGLSDLKEMFLKRCVLDTGRIPWIGGLISCMMQLVTYFKRWLVPLCDYWKNSPHVPFFKRGFAFCFFVFFLLKQKNLLQFWPALGVGFTPASPLSRASNNPKITVMLPQQNWKSDFFPARVPACARMCLRCVWERGWERDIEEKAERRTQAGVSPHR